MIPIASKANSPRTKVLYGTPNKQIAFDYRQLAEFPNIIWNLIKFLRLQN